MRRSSRPGSPEEGKSASSENSIDADRRSLEEFEEQSRLRSLRLRAASGEIHGMVYTPVGSSELPEDQMPQPQPQAQQAEGADVEKQQHDDDSRPNAHSFEPVPPERQLILQFKDMCAYVPTQLQQPNLLQKAWQRLRGTREAAKQMRQILFNLSGEIRPSEVLALMGPSGSGKTTLLSILGGRAAKTMKVTGSVTVNGHPFTKATRRRIGFVLQDDVLYEDLTVYETLLYAALLRLPRMMSTEEKKKRVEAVIDVLGLRKSKNTIIGGFFRRGISGGERKRVSIGHELLINPAIMMLDEPTSGLDSTTAMHLISLLEELALGGRAVVTTIHQPSSRLYQKLDRLMLLAEGHMMYYGKAGEVLDWFGRFGYSIPFGVSIPDFILDLAMGEAGYSNTGKTGTVAVQELYTSFEKYLQTHPNGYEPQPLLDKKTWNSAHDSSSREGMPSDVDLVVAKADSGSGSTSTGSPHHHHLPGSTQRLAADQHAGDNAVMRDQEAKALAPFQIAAKQALPEGGNYGGNHGAPAGKSPHTGHYEEDTTREGASYLQQVGVLLQRAARVRRFEQMTGQNAFQLLAVAFITGLVWWQRGLGYTIPAATDVMGLLFFALLFPSMRALFRALFTLPNEYRMLMKERPSGMYRLSAYYIARTMADIPSEMLNAVVFVIIIYWFGGLKHDAGAFFAFLASILLVVLVAEAWGLLIGGIFMQPKTAQTVVTVVILTFLLVGGYYVRSIPIWIGWIRYISFIYWGFNLLLKIQFRDSQYYQCSTNTPQGISQGEAAGTPGCTPVNNIQTTLGLPTYPEDNPYPEVLVLLGMLLFLRIMVYYVLRRKTRTRKTL